MEEEQIDQIRALHWSYQLTTLKLDKLKEKYYPLENSLTEVQILHMYKKEHMLEITTRRIISLAIFIALLFSPLILAEIIFYSIQYVIIKKSFPKDPYCFSFLKRMW